MNASSLISAWKMIVKQRVSRARCGTNGLNERDTRDSQEGLQFMGSRTRYDYSRGPLCFIAHCRRRTILKASNRVLR